MRDRGTEGQKDSQEQLPRTGWTLQLELRASRDQQLPWAAMEHLGWERLFPELQKQSQLHICSNPAWLGCTSLQELSSSHLQLMGLNKQFSAGLWELSFGSCQWMDGW